MKHDTTKQSHPWLQHGSDGLDAFGHFARGFVPPGEPTASTCLLTVALAAAITLIGWWLGGG